uniref:Uncharacterized protein n=1 Tax=Rhizophora mucronata TaxID=61149 RepID=A0A2P2NML3_RHIMU
MQFGIANESNSTMLLENKKNSLTLGPTTAKHSHFNALRLESTIASQACS